MVPVSEALCDQPNSPCYYQCRWASRWADSDSTFDPKTSWTGREGNQHAGSSGREMEGEDLDAMWSGGERGSFQRKDEPVTRAGRDPRRNQVGAGGIGPHGSKELPIQEDLDGDRVPGSDFVEGSSPHLRRCGPVDRPPHPRGEGQRSRQARQEDQQTDLHQSFEEQGDEQARGDRRPSRPGRRPQVRFGELSRDRGAGLHPIPDLSINVRAHPARARTRSSKLANRASVVCPMWYRW